MRRIISVGLLLVCSSFSFAQNTILAGKVVDENNKPLPGAIIAVSGKHEKTQAVSDADGLYYTKLLPGESTA